MSRIVSYVLPILLVCLISACGGDSSPPSVGISPGVTPPGGVPSPVPPAAKFTLIEATISDVHAAFRGESLLEDGTRLSCRKLVQMYLDRIERLDDGIVDVKPLNAVLSINPNALTTADVMDAEMNLGGGPTKPLHCIPLLLKDNVDTFDLATTAGSLALAGSIPPNDAFVTARLRAAGAIILGKANMDEFAFGTYGVSGQGTVIANPYDTTKTPGGSSGGSAAATAANLAMGSLGSDTCASIRYPSTVNALVGIRSSLGLVSQDGVIPLQHVRDVVGPIMRTVTDATRVLDVIAAPDAADPKTQNPAINRPASYLSYLSGDNLRGVRIGVVRDIGGSNPFGNGLPDAYSARVTAAVETLRALGAEIVDPVNFPDFVNATDDPIQFQRELNDYLRQTPAAPYQTMAAIAQSGKVLPTVEASMLNYMLRTPSDPDDPAGAATPVSVAAIETQIAYVHSVMDAADVDLVVYPGTTIGVLNSLQTVSSGSCSLSAVTGTPVVNVPIGFSTLDPKPIPQGMEIMARRYQEGVAIHAAYVFEQATHYRRPPPAFE